MTRPVGSDRRLAVIHRSKGYRRSARLADDPRQAPQTKVTHLFTLRYNRATGLTAGAFRDLWANCRKLIVRSLSLPFPFFLLPCSLKMGVLLYSSVLN